jgi:hypothetical protein
MGLNRKLIFASERRQVDGSENDRIEISTSENLCNNLSPVEVAFSLSFKHFKQF